jgi:hypothetical protein
MDAEKLIWLLIADSSRNMINLIKDTTMERMNACNLIYTCSPLRMALAPEKKIEV